jgi:phosphonate transport system substrate-binding protein
MMLGLLCGVAVGTSASAAEAAPPVLRFSAIPDQDETRLREKFEPIARFLQEQLGVPVEYVHATRYADSVELFKNGDIQLGWFGGLTGAQAREAVDGARAIAQGEEDPHFYSYFIAHRSAGIAPSDAFPAALAGKKFAFGSAGSTSGRLMPEHFIRNAAGKTPRELFASISFSGSHDRTAELVASGQFDAGAISFMVYDRRVAEGTTDPEQVQVIWKTPTYPDYNFTAHPMLEETYGPGFIDRLQKTLIGMNDPALLSAFPRRSLIPASNADFDSIRKLAIELDFLRER